MTSPAREPRWLMPEAAVVAGAGAVVVAAVGVLLSRPDVIAVALVPALWLVKVIVARRASPVTVPRIDTVPDTPPAVPEVIVSAASGSELVELSIVQARRDAVQVLARTGESASVSLRLLHTGPAELVRVHARALSADGALIGPVAGPVIADWQLEPSRRHLADLPLSRRLIGMHGLHQGTRPGRGGDFRDIHPFAPGDEVRRIDWRVTARVARTPGELFVRRTNTLSDAEIVLVADTSVDLGARVSTWGTGDLVSSGPTTLDATREAAISLAGAAVDVGDRVSFHELSPGGRIIPSAGGRRAAARLSAVLGELGVRPPGDRTYRMPQVRPGSTVFVLSAFFHGPAAALAEAMRAAGHRVVAIDVLPPSDLSGLTTAQQLAARMLFLERADVLGDLRRTGVDVVAWTDDAEATAALLLAAGRRR